MTGIIKKKGKLSMQGYKDREFTVDRDGIMRYGDVGEQNKWKKKIKLSDIRDVQPQEVEPRHSFTLTKKDGRVLFFVARNDEEKWKWINGFRAALRVVNKPNISVLDTPPPKEPQQTFIPMLKLSKYSTTGIWRWRFFVISDGLISYYNDPGLGQFLGSFTTKSITKISVEKEKYGQDVILQVDVKTPEKRSYFLAQPDQKYLTAFHKLCIPQTHGFFNFFK